MGLADLLAKNIRWVSGIAALLPLPYCIRHHWEYKNNTYPDDTIFGEALCYWPSLAAALTVNIGIFASTLYRRTNLEHYKKIKKLKAQLKQQTPPTIAPRETVQIPYKLKDFLWLAYRKPEKNAERARQQKNPLIALDAAIMLLSSKPDEAFAVLRDASDWLEGKKPVLTLATKLQLFCQEFTYKTMPTLDVCGVSTFLFRALYDSIRCPENAWYWSTLGKIVADTTGKYKKEMYAFHALLATAQQRSDQKEAWEDTFNLLHQTCKPERIGESRNLVWKIKDESKQFLSDTCVFKANKKRTELEKEWQATLNLERILDDNAVAPQPLYITETPYQDLYVYVMRSLNGELLYDQFAKGDYSGLNSVKKVLARILARYPTTGLQPIDIEKKHEDKLYALDIPKELANDIISHLRPVNRALQENAVLVPNKDGHPEQWQILNIPYLKARVGVLDAEINNLHPAINEAVNLLEYAGELSPEERRLHASTLMEELRKEGRATNNKELAQAYEDNTLLERAYNNSVIHRAISWASAWSDPERPTMHKKRGEQINKALRAIAEQEKTAYYEEYRIDYEALRRDFQKMRELMSP